MMTKFTSESGRSTNAANYLSEYIVRRQSKKKRITLPKAYWQVKYKGKYVEWIKILSAERVKAKALLKVYEIQTVLNVLKANEWIISLFVRRLETMLQEEQRKRDLTKEAQDYDVKVIEDTTSVSKQFGKKSKRSKLKD